MSIKEVTTISVTPMIGKAGHWSIASVTCMYSDLQKLVTHNVENDSGDLRRSKSYFDRDLPIQRKPVRARVDALKAYISSKIDTESGTGALPALTLVVIGKVSVDSDDGTLNIKLEGEDGRCLIADGMGRYTALTELYQEQGLDLPIAVTIFANRRAKMYEVAQLLHDINRYSTNMRPVTAAKFMHTGPFADMHERLESLVNAADLSVPRTWLIADGPLMLIKAPELGNALKVVDKYDVKEGVSDMSRLERFDIPVAIGRAVVEYPAVLDVRYVFQAVLHGIGAGFASNRPFKIHVDPRIFTLPTPHKNKGWGDLQRCVTVVPQDDACLRCGEELTDDNRAFDNERVCDYCDHVAR